MSKEALTKVVQRSISDAAFRRQLATDATGALRGYDLTSDELGAIRSRDAAKLTAFGVDVRMSKVFTLDPGMAGTAAVTGGEPRDIAPVWIGDSATTIDPALTAGEPRDSAPAWIGDGGTTVQPVHTYSGDDLAGPEAALTSSEPRDIAPVWIGDGSENTDAALIANEPRDVAPTWIGEGGATGSGFATDEGQITGAFQTPTEPTMGGDGDLQQ